MGKKGNWFTAIKRVFTPHSKDKLANEPEKKTAKDKKKKGRENNSFLPIFREPSSIEKILGDAEREHSLVFRPPTPLEQPRTPPFVPPPPPRVASPRIPSQRNASPRAASPRAGSPKAASPRATSPRAAHTWAPSPSFPAPPPPRAPSPQRAPSARAPSPKVLQHRRETGYRPEPTLRNQHISATRIQAAYRGYAARRSFRALKGLVRLQGVIRGQSVKRQTMNAMKYMQLLVRVQSQIQSRRIQMLENQARRQTQSRNDKDGDNTYRKWNFDSASEAGNDNWDDSVLTKVEVETRTQRKVEAIVKRERAMAYSYSHQLWKSTPNSAHPTGDNQPAGYQRWWNWVDMQLPLANTPENQSTKGFQFQLTPQRPTSELKPSPRPLSRNYDRRYSGFDFMETPKSTKSTIVSTRHAKTPPPYRMSLANNSNLPKYSRPRNTGAGSPFDLPLKDDDSLTSCPPFSVPNYMTPTYSAKAKVRANSNPKERFPGTPSSESKRRMSFPFSQGIGSFKWGKGKDSSSQLGLDKNRTFPSVGNMSVDSTVSMPATMSRKPFNRFV
ncbi:hypothetical protein ACFE04_006016 [Oxalis oulophora]